MSNVNKIGESGIVSKPDKVLKIKIADGAVTSDKLATGAVTTGKIAEGAVSVNTLGEDVQLAIEGVQQAGLLVSQELGNSQVIGVSQKKITEEIGDIKNDLVTLNGVYYNS